MNISRRVMSRKYISSRVMCHIDIYIESSHVWYIYVYIKSSHVL